MFEGLDEKYTKTGNYIIGFIDVLGVKNKVKNNLTETLEELWLVNHFLSKEKYKNKDLIVRSFSDNYLIALEIKDDNVGQPFSDICNIIGNLVNRGLRIHNTLFRGAITIGSLHIDDNIVLGEGLIKAYSIESEIAIYPRIVIDSKLITKSSNITNYSLSDGIFQDFDLQWCLNPLKFCDDKFEKVFKDQLFRNVCIQLSEAMKSKNERVMTKIKWLINYINSYYKQNHNEILIDISKFNI